MLAPPELVIHGSSRSATSCSRTATVAEDFPHGKGSWMSDMSSIRGRIWERRLGLGKYNREPSTEPKEPSTGTEKTGTEKFRFYFGSTF